MVTIIEELSVGNGGYFCAWEGLSTDTKPSGKYNGSVVHEIDTGKVFSYNEATDTWVEQ